MSTALHTLQNRRRYEQAEMAVATAVIPQTRAEAWEELVRHGQTDLIFAYDHVRKHYWVESQSKRKRYELHALVDGTVLVTSCGCPDAVYREHLCKHQDAFRPHFERENPGVVITDHVHAKGHPLAQFLAIRGGAMV